MSLNVGNMILALDYNDLKAMVDNELGVNRRNLTSYNSPDPAYSDNLAMANQINPIITGLKAINSDLVTVTATTANRSLLYSISNLSTTVATLGEKPKEGTNSGCKSGCVNLCQGCVGGCEDGCTETCSGTCSGGCSTGCSGCTSCNGCTSCSGCGSNCGGSCSGACGGCGDSCRNGCALNCADECKIDVGLS